MEELTPLQTANISNAIKKHYNSEKIVNYDLDFSKWEIEELYANALWVQLIDEPDADTVVRNGIAIPASSAKGLYRIGRVLMSGVDAKHVKKGDYIRFPLGVGAKYEVNVGGYKTWLLREDMVMMKVKPPFDTEEEIRTYVEDTILLQK